MCQSIGLPPISTIGLGLVDVSSDKRVPKPQQVRQPSKFKKILKILTQEGTIYKKIIFLCPKQIEKKRRYQ